MQFHFHTTFLLVIISFQLSLASNPDFEQRKTDYINTALVNFNGDAITLQAQQGVALDNATLTNLLDIIPTKTTSDFDIVKLIRILFFTNGVYDSQILPVLYSVPYWLTHSDTVRNYWSENHMIMWMSSDWLLHEKYGKTIDANLDARLRHYLNLKVQYGFYEFFSSVYAPYSLSGLLNLADFAQDAQIKSLATQAAQRLLKDMLLLTNDKGVFFPAAGRNYPSRYTAPYGQNHTHLIYLLTGFGQVPAGASHTGAFLASSSLPVDDVIASWSANVDTLYSIGHSLEDGYLLNSSMSSLDKIIFQWSSGAYFHPDVVLQTTQLLVDSNLWRHVDFKLLQPLSFIPPQDFPALATNLGVISKSSVISGQDIAIFKHHSVTLSSIQDFWKGKVGFQQHPCVANVGTTAVYTASGKARQNWNNRSPDNANIHLPFVSQKKNLALIMYLPEPTPALLGSDFSDKEVALYWDDADFDEVVNAGLWLLGRQESSYVAVRRSCTGEISNVRACATNGGQTWVLMVGDSVMYGSFSNFQNIIQQSQFTEELNYDSLSAQWVYFAKIMADTLSIEYTWNADSVLFATGIKNVPQRNFEFNIFPNPGTEKIYYEMNLTQAAAIKLELISLVGQIISVQSFDGNAELKGYFEVAHLLPGIYFAKVTAGEMSVVKKLIVN